LLSIAAMVRYHPHA